MLEHGHVVYTGDDQATLARVLLLNRHEVFKKLAATFIRIDATTVEQIRRAYRLGLSKLCVDRHRNDSSRQIAPELLAYSLFRCRQPDQFTRTPRRVFVRRK